MKDISKIIEEQEVVEESKVDEFIVNLFKFFEGLQRGMSSFQINNFVLSDEEFPTSAAKYWQCKTEIFVRMKGLVFELISYKRVEIELEEKIMEVIDNPKKKEVDVFELKFKRFLNAMKIKELIRETSVFLKVLGKVEKDLSKDFKIDKELSESESWRMRAAWKRAKTQWLKNMPLDYLQSIDIHAHGGEKKI